MVERVAKAMFDSFQETQVAHPHRNAWNSRIGLGLQPYYREAARAAIRALREPTEEMLERGQGCLDFTPIKDCVDQARKVWVGMIWAALE